jgi:hypothetical protein
LSIRDHVPEDCVLKFVSPCQRIGEADFFYKYKKKRAEKIQDVHENNILNVNVNVVNALEITHIADSYECKQNTPFNTTEWFVGN